ncbi:uncharacterized protein ACB058_011920 [Synchiropus picturatus]
MDEELLSLTSSSSSAEEADKPKDLSPEDDSRLPQSPQGDKAAEDLCLVKESLLPVEEQHSVITDSMTVTSTDQEKLLLLNRNTELRRVNRELMKLNEDWDSVYRSATQGLQKQLRSLELENGAVKHLTGRLLLKAEQQQAAKDYYERELIQEMKKNQELQNHIQLLESRQHRVGDSEAATQGDGSPGMYGTSLRLPPTPEPPSSQPGTGSSPCSHRDAQQEVKELTEQLEALRHQVKIYEAEYQCEHKTHKQTKQENQRLRRKREEMGQQVALLREQLKIYEDDFYRERSDKQVLQRLLMKKAPTKEAVLVHRCNNAEQPYERQKAEHAHRKGGQVAARLPHSESN